MKYNILITRWEKMFLKIGNLGSKKKWKKYPKMRNNSQKLKIKKLKKISKLEKNSKYENATKKVKIYGEKMLKNST